MPAPPAPPHCPACSPHCPAHIQKLLLDRVLLRYGGPQALEAAAAAASEAAAAADGEADARSATWRDLSERVRPLLQTEKPRKRLNYKQHGN